MAINNPGAYHEKVYNAYVLFQLDKSELSRLPPEHIRSFTVERVSTGSVNKFSLECYDDTAIQIEASLAFGERRSCTYGYGFVDGPQSDIFYGQILNYEVTLTRLVACC